MVVGMVVVVVVVVVVAVVAAVLAVATVPVVPTAVAGAPGLAGLVAQADAAPTPVLGWPPCVEPGLERFDCAVARVPLGYARPHGPTLGLAVARMAAGG